jgi:hypothetical protein
MRTLNCRKACSGYEIRTSRWRRYLTSVGSPSRAVVVSWQVGPSSVVALLVPPLEEATKLLREGSLGTEGQVEY